ncbi:MAG: hypothetical protein JWP38_645 [Herbaspirillum sp.]|nr:hypothetical protein [Herbaspirillum sp.]
MKDFRYNIRKLCVIVSLSAGACALPSSSVAADCSWQYSAAQFASQQLSNANSICPQGPSYTECFLSLSRMAVNASNRYSMCIALG